MTTATAATLPYGTLKQLGYIGIESSKLDEWETFGTEVLGAQLSHRGEDGSLFLRTDDLHHRLAVHPGPAEDWSYLGWRVGTQEDLDLVEATLRANGYDVEVGSREVARARKVAGLIQTADPDGLRTEIYFGPFEPDELFRPSKAMAGSFVAGDLGFGHAAFTVTDSAATLRFYREVLGLRVSDFSDAESMLPDGGWINFLRCNERHHALAFGQRQASEQRLHHILLEVDTLDDVGRTMDLVEERGIPIMQTLGKHNNDMMVSVYFQSPSAFEIEYGCGGRLVDDDRHAISYRGPTELWGHKRAGH